MNLRLVLEQVPDAIAAAWVDMRTSELLDRRLVTLESHVSFALEAIAAVLSTTDRPRRSVLLSRTHIFIAHQIGMTSTALLVACTRSANLGFSIAAVRSLSEQDQ